MDSSDSPFDYVDYASIRFPSDGITIGRIRRSHPERFDVEDGERFERTTSDPKFQLNTLIYLERLLARAAYEKALGKRSDVLGERGLDGPTASTS